MNLLPAARPGPASPAPPAQGCSPQARPWGSPLHAQGCPAAWLSQLHLPLHSLASASSTFWGSCGRVRQVGAGSPSPTRRCTRSQADVPPEPSVRTRELSPRQGALLPVPPPGDTPGPGALLQTPPRQGGGRRGHRHRAPHGTVPRARWAQTQTRGLDPPGELGVPSGALGSAARKSQLSGLKPTLGNLSLNKHG